MRMVYLFELFVTFLIIWEERFKAQVVCDWSSSEREDFGPSHDAVTGDYNTDVFTGFGNNTGNELQDCSETENSKLIGSAKYHPDSDLSVVETIQKYGFDVEEHKVHTEDGYILTVFRIPGSPLSPKREGKIPAYLNHGLLGNAFSWLFLYGNGSLAYKLANAGYDVFLGNSRGNKYSNMHEYLDPESDEYWDFSWGELGQYDVPAVIDYILNVTGQQDTYYIGHSMGTSQYLVAMSTRPEYGEKIRVGFLLAPAGYISTMYNLALRFLLTTINPPYYETWKLLFGHKVDQESINKIFVGNKAAFCSPTLIKCGACDSISYLSFGYNPEQVNKSITNYFQKKYFDTGSTKILTHFQQIFQRDTFSPYDYGDFIRNTQAYGQPYPSPYPLEKINAPTVIYFSVNDNIIPPKSTKLTVSKFTPGVIKENNRVQLESFTHNDFLTGKDLEKLVTNRVVWIMDKQLYVKKNKPIIVSEPGALPPQPKLPKLKVSGGSLGILPFKLF